MKDSLTAGLTVTRRFLIDKDRTIDFLCNGLRDKGGSMSAVDAAVVDLDTADEQSRVYSTPRLVEDIETTCRDMLLEHLEPGEDSLGTRVDVEHLAPTLLGMWVDITARVTDVKGRAVTFEITARDPVDDQVARARHGRFVIEVAKTRERLAAKAAKAAEAA